MTELAGGTKSRNAVLKVLALAAVLRIIWALLVPVHPVSDGIAYDSLAQSLASGFGYCWVPGHPVAFWPVGTSFVYSLFYRAFGHTYTPIVVFNIALSLATIWLSMFVAERWFGQRAALLAGIVLALWPGQIEFTSALQSEFLFSFLLAVWLALRETTTLGRWTKALLIGVTVAATCYVRPVALVLPAVLCAVDILRERKVAASLASVIVIYAVMAVLIAPWSLRNLHVFGKFYTISTNSGANLWMGNHPGPIGETATLPPETDTMPEAQVDVYLGNIAKVYIKQHPGWFVLRALKRSVKLYERESIGVHWNDVGLTSRYGERVMTPLKVLSNLYWWVVLLLGVAGVAVVAVERGVWNAALCLPLVLWAYFTVIYAVYVVQDRYHYSASPFLAMFAGVALGALAGRRSAGNSSSV